MNEYGLVVATTQDGKQVMYSPGAIAYAEVMHDGIERPGDADPLKQLPSGPRKRKGKPIT